LITQVTSGGPADKAGLRAGTNHVQIAGNSVTMGGEIVIGINGTRITNMDDFSTYLEECTLPGQTIAVDFVRSNEILTTFVQLQAQPQLM
jgi:S1-C subfamily serine protease